MSAAIGNQRTIGVLWLRPITRLQIILQIHLLTSMLLEKKQTLGLETTLGVLVTPQLAFVIG
jgi:hypothetical protein